MFGSYTVYSFFLKKERVGKYLFLSHKASKTNSKKSFKMLIKVAFAGFHLTRVIYLQ